MTHGGQMTTRQVLVAVATLFTLAACGNTPSNPEGPRGAFRTAVVDVDGRKIPCITWKDGYAGGISCDWTG
jgi:hypothetical protein